MEVIVPCFKVPEKIWFLVKPLVPKTAAYHRLCRCCRRRRRLRRRRRFRCCRRRRHVIDKIYEISM